jgi:hypothetical protein
MPKGGVRPPKGEKKMKSRFLTVMVAVAGLFIAQQAVSAKTHTTTAKTNSKNKKHHKKHTPKTAGLRTVAPAAAVS